MHSHLPSLPLEATVHSKTSNEYSGVVRDTQHNVTKYIVTQHTAVSKMLLHAKSHYTECHYAECRDANCWSFSVIFNISKWN